MMTGSRRQTLPVSIGHVFVGSDFPVKYQTMNNTATDNIEASLLQIDAIKYEGCDLIRLAVPTMAEVEPMRQIVQKAHQQTSPTALVADVHYYPQIAEEVALFVDKVRINPGNFLPPQSKLTDEQYETLLYEKTKLLFERCKAHKTAIRIGVNQGSLSARMIAKYGHSTETLAQSAMEWIKVCEHHQYHNVIFSLKSSTVRTLFDANMRLVELMKESRSYPLHIGVTEAANEMEGRVKSAMGIGGLLLNGIGDTFRVSLTEQPEAEIVFAKLLLEAVNEINIAGLKCEDGTLSLDIQEPNREKWWAKCAAIAGYYYANHKLKNVKISSSFFSKDEQQALVDVILQVAQIKRSKTEIVACPSCGRTQYDIQAVLKLVKERYANYPQLKIAVMGCVVNGPGEMTDADIGVVGSANNKLAIYKNGERISKFLPVEETLTQLGVEIEQIINERG